MVISIALHFSFNRMDLSGLSAAARSSARICGHSIHRFLRARGLAKAERSVPRRAFNLFNRANFSNPNLLAFTGAEAGSNPSPISRSE
jgi:hypothetical protein